MVACSKHRKRDPCLLSWSMSTPMSPSPRSRIDENSVAMGWSRCPLLESELSARARNCFTFTVRRRWQKGTGVPLEVVFPRVTVGNEHRVLLASAGISRETVSNDSRIIAPEERFRSAEVFGSELGNLRFRVWYFRMSPYDKSRINTRIHSYRT